MKDGQVVRKRVRLADAGGGVKAPTGSRPRQSQILLEILNDAALFHAADGTPYADLEIKGRSETWKVRSLGFREWLNSSFYRRTGGVPNYDAMQRALLAAEAEAKYAGVQRQVHVRVGSRNGEIYIDLADADWRAIKICANGWNIVSRPEVRFIRAKGMLPLPTPVPGGAINKLRDFINVKADEDFILVTAWVLAALRDTGPYPVLAAIGEQGSAKSTMIEILRSLVDPNFANLRSPPRDDRNLFIAAGNAHVLAYDNLSGLPSWLSDGLARISTGAAHATRLLYADNDEVLMQAEKPIALNGITDFVNRADLADRCIFVTAERILDKDRKPKQDLLAAFEAERPRILGALLDAVAHGIKTLPSVIGNNWPRMADFAKWATACAFASPGSFRAAYNNNRIEAVESLLDDDLVATAAQMLTLPWEGTASELLAALNHATNNADINAKAWPKDGKALSGRLRRLAPLLRTKGVNAEKLTRTSARRRWSLTRIEAAERKRDLPSSPSPVPLAKLDGGIGGDDDRAVKDIVTTSVTAKPVETNGSDDCDVSDDKSARSTGRHLASASTVLSDIDPVCEELRARGASAAWPAQGARRTRPRIRIRLSADSGNSGDAG